jgi:hypothetical protein
LFHFDGNLFVPLLFISLIVDSIRQIFGWRSTALDVGWQYLNANGGLFCAWRKIVDFSSRTSRFANIKLESSGHEVISSFFD